jgi:enamine deaminase RidA (YjgF/YER057c/UK114 family)
VFVSGTTASDDAGATQHPGDPDAQMIYVLRKIESALEEAGATLADVVRTRVFVRNIEDSEAVARAHGSIFADMVPPIHCCAANRSIRKCWSRSRSRLTP